MRGELDIGLVRGIDRAVGALLLRLLALRYGAAAQRPPRRPPEPSAVRRILCIKLYGVGNLALMLPAVESLRARFPSASVELLTLERNLGFAEGTPWLAAAHGLRSDSVAGFLGSALRALPGLRRRRFDLVVDFEQFALVSALLTALTGAPFRAGFANPARTRDLLYTHQASYLDYAHMTRIFLRLARAVGGEDVAAPYGPLRLLPKHLEEARALERLGGIGPRETVAVLHPGTSEHLQLRRWPAERFAALGDALAERHGARIVLTGGAAEGALVDEVAARMRAPAVRAAGRLSIMGLAALLARAELLVCADTAPVHLAAAAGTPVVGLYGPNTPFLYGPLGPQHLVFYREPVCSPCLLNINAKLTTCRRPVCMEAIDVAEVLAAIDEKYFLPAGPLRPEFKKSREEPGGAGAD